MTDQQPRAPQCPHDSEHPVEWDEEFQCWFCQGQLCFEHSTPALLEQEYQRGFEDGCEASAQADHAHAVEDTEHARGLYYWKLRAEQAEARVREVESAIRWLSGEIPLIKAAGAIAASMRDRASAYCVSVLAAQPCHRCGNPQPDCQCYGSAAMSEDWPKNDVQEAQESVAGWSPSKQDAMLSEVNNVRSGSAAMGHERIDYKAPKPEPLLTDAPHAQCWCGSSVLEDGLCREGHRPCPGCGQWVEWAQRAEWYDHRPGADAIPCPGPAPYGYCTVHPNTPKRNKPAQHAGDTGYLWCPECEEEARDE